MTLQEYQRKRDLTKTPEPGPGTHQAEAGLRFVVHKHAASHLHYDFRLELDGVLKSWAIPKGPSLDPSIKRLAMMVEDHPYEYGSFEGVIPKGNYGAGEVIIWDEGTYHAPGVSAAESEPLLRRGLEKGDLKFVLDGEKLKGEFALVRIKADKDNTWLLIKKKDSYATDKDVTRLDRSVVSNATIEELKEGISPAKERYSGTGSTKAPRSTGATRPVQPAESTPSTPPAGSTPSAQSKSAPPPEAAPHPAPMPHQIIPMLAGTSEEPFDDPDWVFEIKLDGYRSVAEIENGNVRLYSRNKISFNQRFPQVAASLAAIKAEAVLDGEVVALDEQGRSYFQLLQNSQRTGEGSIVYFVFDLLYLNGQDLRRLPLLTRKEMLRALLPDLPNVKYSDHLAEFGRDFFDLARQKNLEGIIAKRGASPYLTGKRSKDWLKIKIRLQQEAVICGFTEPRGSRKWLGSLVLGVYENDEMIYIGLTGGGFDDAALQEVHGKLVPLIREKSPFQQKIKTDMPVTWVKPELVCEVEFSEWTDEGVMRIPIFLGLREDKDPRQVVREVFPAEADAQNAQKALAAPEEAQSPPPKSQLLIIDGRRLELTNLGKVFWPDEGYIKGDVIDYYRTVSRLILPHLQDRPESLYRTPHGITEGGFFQKEAGALPPSWIATKVIYSKHVDKNVKFFVCQDEATLVYMANLGCIEINPWLSRIQNLDYPDYLVIDLDPEDIPFEKVVETALAVRRVLERAGATSFPKTSGATGIHIYVPLGAKYDYHQAEQFAHVIATLAHQQVPEFTSLLRSPSKRQKKVYLDFLQNKPGQTLAAPYSIRPRPGATVSTPLRWEEVQAGLHPSQFTIRSILRRLEQVGDLFGGVLGPGIDIVSCIDNLERGG
ncbi:DNA ligase D [Geomonas sp. Red32]|uniref:DNA ligase D n=1 Tax=Geomonas sp. Red32 TaxID=2912856 RepID=UPI00202D09A1|nr:DNA ligase D [Geomonas sp. Red32]MCM0080761.1 DNA ligase D [Geomonas sp. Red32]